MGQRVEHPVWPLGYVNYTKIVFRPIKCLKGLNVRPSQELDFHLITTSKID